ncbi:MAG: polysaccharide biosynthesis protein [Clostridia bacterium]|nr:polysaccharide biosynthesis protein [Clostridia bacterium]
MKLIRPSDRSRDRFLSGVSVLTVSAVIVKIIGLACRIPLLNALGTEGMGYFNTAVEVYALLCVLSTAGLPVAMSVTISSAPDAGRRAYTDRVFSVSLGAFLALGLTGTAGLYLLAGPIGRLLESPDAAPCIRAVSPTVLLICLSGAFRGWFQGSRRMTPTAVSQIIEALGKLILGLTFAELSRARGADLPHIAASAVLGLTVGTGLSVLYLLLSKRRADKKTPSDAFGLPAADLPSHRAMLRRLASVALPITVSAGVISLTKCLDLALILRRMQDAGHTAAEANALYGCWSTLAVPVFNVLPALTTPVAMSAVPALAGSLHRLTGAGRNDADLSPDASTDRVRALKDARRTASQALGLTTLLSVPAGLGLCLYAEEILRLLFPAQPAAAAAAAPWLSLLGLSVPAACLITVLGAMLQAAGHASYPVISMIAGLAVKLVLSYVLLGDPALGLMGAPISSLCCDTVILTLDFAFLAVKAPEVMPPPGGLLRLFLGPLLLSVPALGLVPLLAAAVGLTGSSPSSTVLRIGATAVLYGVGVSAAILVSRRRGRHRPHTNIVNAGG